MKLVVELWSNAAKNEKPFLRDHKVLATDFPHWQTVSYMKLIVELWSNVAKNEKPFLRNHKVLAIDFHIMERNISIGY